MYEENGKSKDILERLVFLSSTIRRVELVTEFPALIAPPQLDNVQCAALDLSTAIMEYVTLGISHFKTSLGGEQKAKTQADGNSERY